MINIYTGYSAETLMGDDPVPLKVIVPELLPMLEGLVAVSDEPSELEIDAENLATDGPTNAKITPVNSIVCEYAGTNDNSSMPNIHIGEQVEVYHVVDSNKYYWRVINRDHSIRTTEHLKIRVANKPKRMDELNDDTSYFFEMDTREGRRKVRIKTSKGTEEEVDYDILIDTDKSTMHIMDSIGNGWKLDSKERHIKTWNETGSFLDMNKENIHHHAVTNYKVTCMHYIRESEEDDTITTKKTTRVSTDSIDVTTKAFTLTGETTHITASGGILLTTPTLGVSGAIMFGGALSGGSAPAGAPGDLEAPASNVIKETVEVTDGDVTAIGPAGKISLTLHLHDAPQAPSGVIPTKPPSP